MLEANNAHPILDHSFKDAEWKTNIHRELVSLAKRVVLLERAEGLITEDSLNEVRILQEKTLTQNVVEVASSAITLTERLKTQRVAKFQCSWLLLCIVVFFYFGISQLIEADLNERSDWKPEWKRYVLDYSLSTKPYPMPHILIHFYLYPKNETSIKDLDVDTAISQVLNSSFVGEATLTYRMDDFSWSITEQEIEEAVAFDSGSSSQGVAVLVKLTLADPEPLIADWQTMLRVNILSLSGNDTYMVKYFKTKVSRTIEQDLVQYEFVNYDDDWSNLDENDAVQLFFIEYSEKVTQKYQSNEEVDTMESQLTQSIWTTAEDTFSRSGLEVQKGDVILLFKPDLSVVHWEEYVAYGYWDWLTGMGGMFSLISTVFFWIAYYLLKISPDDKSVGILPEMSFVFANFERIRGIQTTT